MRKFLSLIFLVTIILGLIEFGSAKSYQPLKHKWDYCIRAEDLYSLDLDRDMQREFYACTYGRRKSYVNVFDENGEILWNTWVKGKYAVSECASVVETIYILYVDDINDNKDLDLIFGSKVRGEKININPITYIERETDPESGAHKQKLRWKYTHVAGIVTDITSTDMDNDGIKEILVASADGNVYVFSINGNVMNKYELDGSVYDIFTSDVDNDGRMEIIAGTYKSIYLIDGGIKWVYPINKRVSRVYAGDLDDDRRAEIIATDGDAIHVINPDGKSRWKVDLKEIADIGASDIDNDTSTEVLVAVGNNIKAFSSDGSFKWEYSIDDRILSMLLLSENELAINTAKKIYVLETDNSYIKNQTAYRKYLEANNFFLPPKDDCVSALPLAKEALEIFTDINNTEGAVRCSYIIRVCEGRIGEIEAKKKLADEYYSIAKKSLDEGDYENAKIHAQMAMEIYAEIGYSYDIIQCDRLIQEIERKKYEIKLEEAHKYYSEAYWHYTNDDYKNSTIYLERAKEIYVELNYSKGIDDCDFLFSEIERKKKKRAADNFYSLAYKRYQLHEYKDALASLEQALEIYQELNLSDEISKSNSLKNLTESYIKADEYYSIAEEYYKSEKYENATYYANESKNIYIKLKDYKKVVVCDSLLKDIEEKKKEKDMFQLLMTLAVVIILIIFIIIIFFSIRRFGKIRQ